MAQKIMLSLAVFFCWTFALKAEEYKLSSPDKKLEVKLRVEGRTAVSYTHLTLPTN